MSNNIADILGNTTKKTNILGNKTNKTPTNYVKNQFSNVQNYAQNRYEDVKGTVSKLSGTQMILILIIFIILIIMIYLYYRNKKEQEKIYRFNNEPLFMTGIEQNKPHNTKKIYKYIDPENGKVTSYIPGYLFNEQNGTQYTFSFWMFINGKEWGYRFGEWKHIFHRGSAPPSNTESINAQIVGLTTQLPGFWLSPKENRLNCILTTGKSGEERLTIDDIEINKWINIVMVLNNNSVSLYRDGLLERSTNLLQKVRSTKDATYVNYFGGFAGNMAYLQYFNRALTPEEVQKLYHGFRGNIDKYIHHMFDKEHERTKHHKPSDNRQQCNYLAWEKELRQKKDYGNRLKDIYKTLCTNTKNMSEGECKSEFSKLDAFSKDAPLDILKSSHKKLVDSVKRTAQGYEYQTLDYKHRVAYLNKFEYDKIKKSI